MRPLLFATVVLLAACGSDPAPPQAAPTPATSNPTPSPSPSYDPAWKTGFMTDRADHGDRTYSFQVGGTGAGERLRPGMWHTEGGPCTYEAPNQKAIAYRVDTSAGAWEPLPSTVELEPGAVFTVVHVGMLQGPGCIWGWDRA